MHRSAQRIATTLAVSVLLAVCGCSEGGGGTDKAGGNKPLPVVALTVINTKSAEELQPYLDSLTRISGGTLTISGDEKYASASASAEVEAIKAIQEGKADLALVGARAWHEAGVSSFDALIAPMAVDSMALEQKVLTGTIPDRMLQGVSPLGLVGIGVLSGPVFKLNGITRPLLAPGDLRGAAIGINRSVVAARSFQALGATPVASPFNGADITSYDGIAMQVSAVAGNGYDGVVRSITANLNLWPRPNVLVGNAKALRRLSAAQLGQLRAAAHDSLAATVQGNVTADSDYRYVLCNRGRLVFEEATSAQLAAWRAAFEPALSWLRQDRGTAAFLDEIAALRASGVTPFPAEHLACGPKAATSSAAARPVTPFDGVYTMDSSEADALRRHPNNTPDNWGHWVFVFSRGRFAFTQENARACTWSYGTYTVTGGHLHWLYTDSGDSAPRHGNSAGGEELSFAWTRYRDTMTLSADAGDASPDNFYLRPWHRISSTPSGSSLSKRCLPPAEAMTW